MTDPVSKGAKLGASRVGSDAGGVRPDAIGALVHGSAVALGPLDGVPGDAWAVLLRGAPGSGKSDLALRLIERGGVLVSDDQVKLSRSGGLVVSSAPETITGLLEVRGVGIVKVRTGDRVPVALILDLVPREEVPRLPDARTDNILGVELPVLSFYPFEASAIDKVYVALRSLLG
jgi:HPr kinase/phosphorylase